MRASARARTRGLLGAAVAVLACTTFIAGTATAGSAAPATGQDDWSITAIQGGHKITLRLAEPLPVRDAVPELAVDGASLGPATESADGKTLTIVTADPRAARASKVEVAWNGVVAGAAKASRGGAPEIGAPPVARPANVPVDPATPGPYAVTRDGYDLGDTALTLASLGGHPSEIRAAAYLPQGARGARPVVVFLHGRHSACYNPTTRRTSSQWPCPADQLPIDSYRGYDAPAAALASHGYVVVSISANGINAADNPFSDDRGQQARGELVLRHLDLLAAADRGQGDPQLVRLFKGRLDLSNIGLMGHSRGGEGVVKAALLNAGRAKPYGITAVLPLAPTDYARASLPDVPMAIVLPYCDGDVENQMGQHYFDDSRYADGDDTAFRSALMVMGTNHNYFNTEWTPGVATAPASDDWPEADDPTCGATAPTRLSAAEQYAVGTTYIAGFFRLVQGHERSMLPLFDGTATAASAGRAVVHAVTQTPASRRLDVARFTSASESVTISGAATGGVCASMLDLSPQSGLPSCASTLTDAQAPSWTTAMYAPNVVATPVLRFDWTGTSGQVTAALPKRARNVSGYDALTFRAALDDSAVGDVDLTVTVVDGRGKTRAVRVSSVSDALTRFPGASDWLPKIWLRTVRISTASLTGLNLRDVRQVRISGASATGGVYLADLAFASLQVGRSSLAELPQVTVQGVTVAEGDGPGSATMTVAVSRRAAAPITVNIQSLATGAGPVITQAAQQVVIPARARSATFQVPVAGNTTVAPAAQTYQIIGSAPTNAVIGNGFARLVVIDDDATDPA